MHQLARCSFAWKSPQSRQKLIGTSLIKPLSIKRIYIYKNNGTMEHLNVFNGLTPVFYGTRMEHTEHLNVFNDLAALSYSPYWYPTCGQLP
jgi:hypothetical protein